MKVIGYTRVSTDEQVEHGVSLQAQGERIRAFCQAKDWQLVDIIVDEGISGKNLHRPGLQSILTNVPRRNGKRQFDAIVVCKLDRLTRSVGDLATLNRLFDQHKVNFISIAESVDTSTASGRLFHNIIASLSEWEREIIGERTKDALKHKRNNGQRAGEIPYGYKLKGNETLEHYPQEQAVLKEIKFLRHSLQLSYRKIAQVLKSKGVPTKKGKARWYPATVHSVLKYADKS